MVRLCLAPQRRRVRQGPHVIGHASATTVTLGDIERVNALFAVIGATERIPLHQVNALREVLERA